MKIKLLFIFFLGYATICVGQETFKIKRLKVLDVKKESTNAFVKSSSSDKSARGSSSNSEMGVIDGALSVSLTGGAAYNVPIKVPPGINGIKPEIALTYNSQAGDGLAGYGWNVSGISVITRIPSTKFHDDDIEPVDLTGTDRFSFDGQRLLLKSGTYGTDGAVYQTEKYSNVKIESVGTYYNGPNYFKVSYPDGSKAYYGKNSSSRSRTDYAITYWENPQGVRISYDYYTSNNTLRIDNIKYGSKGTATPVNEIQFEYAGRGRPLQSYVGGVRFVREKILKKIKVIGNGSGYRNYELSHESNSLGYQRLTSVTEKNGDHSLSYDPINFHYNTTASGIDAQEVTADLTLSNIEQRNAVATSLDTDGEGLMDFTIHPKSASQRNKFWLFKNVLDEDGSLLIPYEVTVGQFETLFPATWLTYNNKLLSGQGVVVVQNSGDYDVKFRVLGQHYYYGLATQYTKTWNAPTYERDIDCEFSFTKRIPQKYISGDFDGDGLTDVVAIDRPYSTRACYPILPPPLKPYSSKKDSLMGPKQKVSKRVPPPNDGCRCENYNDNSAQVTFINLKRDVTSNFANNAGYLSSSLQTSYKLLTGDVNGDGKTDIIQVTSGKVYVYSLDENNHLTLLFSKSNSDFDTDFPVFLGDYNGDGKTDLMIPKADNSSSFALFLSEGTTFYSSTFNYPFTYKKTNYDGYDGQGTMYGYNLVPTDINGDGKTDILDYRTVTHNSGTSGSQTIKVYKNSSPPYYHANPHFTYSTIKSRYGDLHHYPVPVFLNSEKHNKSLEFASISDNKITTFRFHKNNQEDMLLRGITKNGVTKDITYSDLSPEEENPDYSPVYQKGYEAVYPYADIEYAKGFKVVNRVERSGYGLETVKKDYFYYGAVSNFEGLGFAGFKGTAQTNWYKGYNDKINHVAKYDPLLRGAVIREYSTTSYLNFTSDPSNYISKTDNFYNTNPLLSSKVFKLKLTSSLTQNQLNGTYTNKDFTYDTYNNPLTATTNYSGDGNKSVSLEYENSTAASNYHIGRVTKKTTTTTVGSNSFTTEDRFTYTNGLLTQKKSKGNGTDFIPENYTYDGFGNMTGKTISPPGETPRNTSFEYDPSGRFIITKTDIEGLETAYQYDSHTGNLLNETDPFGFETDYEYDSWFRLKKVTDYLGNEATTTYHKIGDRYLVSTSSDDGSYKSSLYNKLQQLIEEEEKDVLGQEVKRKYEYDALDRIKRESEPYIGFNPSQWNTTEYDRYGRVITKTSYTGKTVDLTYNNLVTTVDDGTKTVTTTKDAMGNVIKKQEQGAGTINYTYFGNGNLKSADYGGSTMTIQQDGWGRKTQLIDPSAGTYTYTYNGYGDVVQETNPNGATDYTYSDVGRLTKKELSGNNTDMTIDYTYNGNTKLLTQIGVADANGSSSLYTYNYDSYHRKTQEKETTDYAQFTTNYTYNNFGQVATEENSANSLTSGKSTSKKVKNTYQHGGLKSISDYTSNDVLWEIDALNARGQILSATEDNGIVKTNTYDNMGFLSEMKTVREHTSGPPTELMKLEYDFDAQRGLLNTRHNSLFNWDESFSYDNLDRLTNFNDNNGNNSHTYDSKGRITVNSQIGNYGYTGTSYQQSSLSLNTNGENYYNTLDHQDITYNSFKKPVQISEYGKDKVSFEYNAFEGRATMFYGGTENDKTQRRYSKHYSANGKMEIKYDNDMNITTFVTYIGGDAYSAPLIWHSEQESIPPPSGEPEGVYYYLHRDYLGSILGITDTRGNFKEKRHFDAWGNIVKLEDGNGNALSSFKILDRGYTGHEHLLGVGIIHMNGRLYDPVVHRFLSPDNNVQDPFNTQNFNRYAYGLNNPLINIDPTGESGLSLRGFFKVLGIVAAVFIAPAVAVGAVYLTVLAVELVGGTIGVIGGITAGVVVASASLYGGYKGLEFLGKKYDDFVNTLPDDPDNTRSVLIKKNKFDGTENLNFSESNCNNSSLDFQEYTTKSYPKIKKLKNPFQLSYSVTIIKVQ